MATGAIAHIQNALTLGMVDHRGPEPKPEIYNKWGDFVEDKNEYDAQKNYGTAAALTLGLGGGAVASPSLSMLMDGVKLTRVGRLAIVGGGLLGIAGVAGAAINALGPDPVARGHFNKNGDFVTVERD